MFKIFSGLIVVSVTIIAVTIFKGSNYSHNDAVLILLLALIVSLVSAFKEDFFTFRPRLLFDVIMMAQSNAPSHDSTSLLLPLTFINKGHGAGVINMLALRVESEN